MAKIEKLEFWSIYKTFEAPHLEAAIELAKQDKSEDWQFAEDDSVEYFFGGDNA
jgi:hypothetical protein